MSTRNYPLFQIFNKFYSNSGLIVNKIEFLKLRLNLFSEMAKPWLHFIYCQFWLPSPPDFKTNRDVPILGGFQDTTGQGLKEFGLISQLAISEQEVRPKTSWAPFQLGQFYNYIHNCSHLCWFVMPAHLRHRLLYPFPTGDMNKWWNDMLWMTRGAHFQYAFCTRKNKAKLITHRFAYWAQTLFKYEQILEVCFMIFHLLQVLQLA